MAGNWEPAGPAVPAEQWEKANPPGAMGTALDIGKGAVKGIAGGVEKFPGAAAGLLGMAGHAVEGAGFGDPEEAAKRNRFMQENQPRLASDALPRPETSPGKYAESITGMIPGVVASGGGWLSSILGAVGGGAGGQVAADVLSTEGSQDEPYARILGSFLGGIVPTALTRAANPLPATARQTANVRALEQEGVTGLTAGQRTGYTPLRYAEEHLGSSPTAGTVAQQRLDLPQEQFTRAVLQRVGINADRSTPALIDRARTTNGQNFDALASRNIADIDQNYMHDLLQAQRDYDHLFISPLSAPIVQNVIDHARSKLMMVSGRMTGQEYKALRSRLERMRSSTQDPEVGQFLGAVRDATDNLMERSIARNNPADSGAWREVRSQYRNLLAVERMTTGKSKGGLISPENVRGAAVGMRGSGRSNYARGRGDFANLGRVGEDVLGANPQSGTAPRSLTSSGVTKLLTTGATGRALMSDPVQAWLGNQEFNQILRQLPSAKQAAIRSILAEEFDLGGGGEKKTTRYDAQGNPTQ